ncbi:MAG: LysR family transcriptional regulator [Terracidiphilus sp.]|jgi:DNA-binding transcriptional LysR family regulator
MEVRQLQIFRILAEELSFTRTAEKVHTVQSNVTAQIKALEEELGIPLFDRLGRRVTLTDAGRNFLPFASQALAAMDQGQQAVQTGAEPSGPLRIGAAESLLTYRLPEVLRAFRRHFPHVELIFRPYSNATLALELEAGKLDMAIYGGDPPPSSSIKSIRLRTERVLLLADASHPLASQPTVKPADLAGQNLLLTEAGCSYREKLDRALALGNIRPANVTEFSSVEAIKQCVAVGMGLALLLAVAVARELRQNHLKALHWAGPSLDINTHILWHKDKWISPAMAAFMELVMDKLKDSKGGRMERAPSWK